MSGAPGRGLTHVITGGEEWIARTPETGKAKRQHVPQEIVLRTEGRLTLEHKAELVARDKRRQAAQKARLARYAAERKMAQS